MKFKLNEGKGLLNESPPMGWEFDYPNSTRLTLKVYRKDKTTTISDGNIQQKIADAISNATLSPDVGVDFGDGEFLVALPDTDSWIHKICSSIKATLGGDAYTKIVDRTDK